MAARGGSEGLMDATSMELRGEREIVIARTFRAPARIVFEAWTKAEHVKRWWAPSARRVEMVECRADVRPGGSYRYLLRKDGKDIAFSGEYTEVTPHTRLVYTQVFEQFPGGPVTVTVTFEEREGETRLVAHELYPSQEVRAAALATGMEQGMRQAMNQLDELIASLCG